MRLIPQEWQQQLSRAYSDDAGLTPHQVRMGNLIGCALINILCRRDGVDGFDQYFV